MAADAPSEAIRVAYRERARELHPDRGESADGAAMSVVNEAYRVLADPGRRALYDRSLQEAPAFPDEVADTVDPDEPWDDGMASIRRASPLSPPGPARMPWKLMLITALAGSAIVLVAAAFNDPPSEEPPDGILRPGSCVEIEVNGDAREIACTGDDDVVVEFLIPTSARCPTGTAAHRDRLGLGIACIRE